MYDFYTSKSGEQQVSAHSSFRSQPFAAARLARRSAAVLVWTGLLLLQVAVATAQSVAQRQPKNAKKDVTKIGNRGVGKAFNLYSLNDDIKMGRDYAKQVEASETIVKDPVVAEFVNRLAQDIARNSDAKVPVTAKVILSDQIKSFALPGGQIYFNPALILLAGDESERAGVMGHEVAHVAARHGTRNQSRAQTAQLIGGLIAELSGNKRNLVYAIANVALPMAFFKFSRKFEKQADFLGVPYLYATGYDPMGMVQFFERLAALSKRKRGAIATLFKTPPPSPKRIRLTQQTINELLPDQPEYEVTGTEFERVKARLRELHAQGPSKR